MRGSMVPNARWQFVLVYTEPAAAKARAVDDLGAAMLDGAIGVGEAHGLPLHHFPLEEAAQAHLAVEQGAVGKVLIDPDAPAERRPLTLPAGRMTAVDEPGDQRWAPFPVQDWSTMPVDLLAAPPAGTGSPSASTAPVGATAVDRLGPPVPVVRARGRPWWVPLAVLLCLGLVVGTGSWLARRAPEVRTAALAYVPADGDALWQQVDETREAVTRTTTQVTESARFAGVDGLLSGDAFLLTRVLHQDYAGDPSASRLWRTTTTSVDDVGVPSQTTRYHRVRGSVELAGERAPDGTVTAYEPALVELPSDVGPGSAWDGAGSAGDTLDYTSSFTAAAGAGGCLEVSGQLVLSPKGRPQVRQQTTETRTWCPGRGVVEASDSSGAVRTVASAAAPPPGPRTTTAEPVGWAAPQAWTPRTWGTVTVDATGETRAMYGSAAVDVHPVLTSSGLVVRALHPPDDLVATTPKTVDAWTPAWSVHPGGTVLTLAAFGTVVLVTTSERRLVAYSDAGMRLWQTTLPEVGPTAPVRVSDDDAVVVDLSGRVLRFGLADGAVRWARSVPGDVDRAPASGAGLVVVADRRGTVTALDAASGAHRWDRSFEATAVAQVGDRVLVAQDQDVIGLDAADGTSRFLTRYDGSLTDLTAFAGRTVVASKEATLLLDADGAVAARLPGYLTVDPTASHLVGWTSDRLDVVAPDGHGRGDLADPADLAGVRRPARARHAAGGLPLRLQHGLDLRLLDDRWLTRTPARPPAPPDHRPRPTAGRRGPDVPARGARPGPGPTGPRGADPRARVAVRAARGGAGRLPGVRGRRGPRGRLRGGPARVGPRPGRDRGRRAPGTRRLDPRHPLLLRAQPAADRRAAGTVVAARARAARGPRRARGLEPADPGHGRVGRGRCWCSSCSPAWSCSWSSGPAGPSPGGSSPWSGRPAAPAWSSGCSRTATRSASATTRCRCSCSTSRGSSATSCSRPRSSRGPRSRRCACA